MATFKAKRPRSATSRKLPPDPKSLAEMISGVNRQLLDRATHLKCAPYDYHARRGFLELFNQRAAACARLAEIDLTAAEALHEELNLTYSQPEVA